MPEKHVKLMLVFIVTLVTAACETMRACAPNCPSDEEALVQAGAVRLTPDQVKARISGKTEDWVRGGAYYHVDGVLEVKWLRVMYKATWEVSADGTLCYQLPKWERRCHFYMDKAGEIYMLDEGKNIGVRATYQGNRLRELGSRVPIHDRSK